MREHLYRGKRVDNGEWVYGDLIKDYFSGQYFIHPYGDSANESDKVGEEGCLRFFSFEVIPETICEFTGLTDKNGNKIFEGDILKARHNSHPYLVSYEECRFKIEDDVGNRVKMTQDAINWLEVELIGNIHDNKLENL